MHFTSDVPAKLYKYTPQQYVLDFIENGTILFRNLTSFRQMEHLARGDVREGCHVDSPSNDVIMTHVKTGRQITGPFSMRTDVNGEKVFVFCMSRTYTENLCASFNSGACIVITDPREFIRRCDVAIKRLLFIERVGCVAGSVEYYSFNKSPRLSIEDSLNIPFLKADAFAEQQEFRLCFGKKKAFELRKRLIVNQVWETEPDHLQGMPQQKFLQVGNLSDITEVRRLSEAGRVDWNEKVELRGEVVPLRDGYSRGSNIERIPVREAVRRVVEERRSSAFITRTGYRQLLPFDEIRQLADRPDYPFRDV